MKSKSHISRYVGMLLLGVGFLLPPLSFLSVAVFVQDGGASVITVNLCACILSFMIISCGCIVINCKFIYWMIAYAINLVSMLLFFVLSFFVSLEIWGIGSWQ